MLCWVLGLAIRPATSFADDQVARLSDVLRGAESVKVRIQAAAVLAKIRDGRVMSALGDAAMWDPDPVVRVFVIKLLAGNAGGESNQDRARAVLGRALRDPDQGVRAQATRSLAALDAASPEGPPSIPVSVRTGGAVAQGLSIAVRSMGDRTGRASPALTERLREALIANLRRKQPGVAVTETLNPGVSYVVDASIARLELVNRGPDVELLCAVELVVSRPPRGIVLVASGEAGVLRTRAEFRPVYRAAMQTEALDNAVKSAFDNFNRFLTAAR